MLFCLHTRKKERKKRGMIRDNSIKAVFPEKRLPHYPEDLTPDRVKQVRTFHESVDVYAVTPLCRLPELAGHLGLKNLYVRDESFRLTDRKMLQIGRCF
jgi:hypothetical protein